MPRRWTLVIQFALLVLAVHAVASFLLVDAGSVPGQYKGTSLITQVGSTHANRITL